jgi:flagellin
MNSVNNNRALDKSLTALSTGLRINKAADDASGMAIANQLKSQASGLGQAIRNANDGINVAQTADGALEEYTNIINTVRTKAIQAASDGQNEDSRKAIQADIDKLLEEAQNIASTTSFNGMTLLNGGFDEKSFHIGAYSGESVKISIDDMQIEKVGTFALAEGSTAITTSANAALTLAASAGGESAVSVTVTGLSTAGQEGLSTAQISFKNAQKLADAFNAKAQDLGEDIRASVVAVESDGNVTGYTLNLDAKKDITVSTATGGLANTSANLKNNLSTIDVTTRDGAEKAITITDYALKEIDKQRSNIGSVQNQLESTVRNISVTQVNVTAAESTIRDVDFAAESANLQKRNILAQSGVYAMSQANAAQQNVMRLLQ